MEKYTLNKNERRIAVFLGKERYSSNRKNGIRNQKAGPQSEYETEVEGVGGELVFAKACNLYPDLGVVPGKFDFTLHGCTVDVKTTKYPDGKLLVSYSKKLEDCDVYVLVTGSMPSYVIAGWLYNNEIINEDHVDDWGKGPLYVAEQSELQPFPLNLYSRR